MAAKRSTRKSASAKDTRARVHDMTVRALRDRDLTTTDITGLVHDALHGAAKTIDASVPSSTKSALRGVFGGLRDAFHAIASAGSKTAASAKRRGQDIAEHAVPTAKKHMKAANEELYTAVSSFAKKTSSELGDELESAVRRARRAGNEVADSARRAKAATGGDYVKLAGDAARVGTSTAGTVAGHLALAASGLLQGLGDVVTPATAKKARRKSSPKLKSKPAKKASGKAAKAGRKKTRGG